MTTHRRILSLVFAAALASIAVGACGSAAAPSAIPTASLSPATDLPSSGDPSASDPGPGAEPAGRLVVPKPGQLDVRPIAAQTLSASVDGRKVSVTISYTSGVEPCSVLDSIVVTTGASAFEITLREGHGPEDVACIEIAEFKHAIVNLGELAPGTYTITDGAGGAAPISVTIA